LRILITGSSGQLGNEVARQLAGEHEIVGLDLAPGQRTTHTGSVSDRALLDQILPGVEAVIHIASLHARHLHSHRKQDFIDTNISGILNLLECCVQAGVRRFVYTSTTSVYGFGMVPAGKAVWVTEALPLQPRDIYDITKIAAEELCRNFALETDLRVICLRTSRFFEEPEELIAAYRLYRGVDVRDVAAAHVLAVTNRQLKFDIFNISAHHLFQKSDLEDVLHNPLPVLERYYPGIEKAFVQRGWKLPASIDRVYVITKAIEQLGYRPKYNFEQLLLGY
jgi:nucleoside-diphosphate-sugar epimerase